MSFDVVAIGIFFITIHLLANNIIPANRIKRMKWFSFSGGLAVSYVFVYVLPSLHKEQQMIKQYGDRLAMESELYFIGLLGLLLFFGVQKIVRKQLEKRGVVEGSSFWIQVVFFAIYNMLIAYIVVSSDVEGVQALFYGIAIGFHFIAVAHDLWRENPEQYKRKGRYTLVGGIFIGWIMGMTITLPPLTQSIIFAFISGAMILNVLINELPNEIDTHFPTFAFGVVSYTTITLALKFFFEW